MQQITKVLQFFAPTPVKSKKKIQQNFKSPPTLEIEPVNVLISFEVAAV
jgi:hypothetical protein